MGGREQNSPIYISRIIPGGVADRYVATQGSKNAKSGCLGHDDLFLCADWLRAMFDKSTDHGNDACDGGAICFSLSFVQEFCSETTDFCSEACSLWFQLGFEHFDFISMANKRTD